MAVFAEFFEHQNFGGRREQFTLSNSWRYWWIKFGSGLANEVTSLRANASSGFNGNVYGFTSRDFLGKYAALNMAEGWTCWWSNVGGLNDDIESALLINRNKLEVVMALKDQIAPDFAAEFDAQAKGQKVHRRGDPRVYAVYFPSFDPGATFVRIEQDLTVELDCWWDYEAQVRFDIRLGLTGNQVNAWVAWTHTWVESGVFSGQISSQLHPKMVAAAGNLNQKLADKLALLNFGIALAGYQLGQVYLLPGRQAAFPPPSSRFGHQGTATEDCCVAISRTR